MDNHFNQQNDGQLYNENEQSAQIKKEQEDSFVQESACLSNEAEEFEHTAAPEYTRYQQKQETKQEAQNQWQKTPPPYNDGNAGYPYTQPNFDPYYWMYQGQSVPISSQSYPYVPPNPYVFSSSYPFDPNRQIDWGQNPYEQFPYWYNDPQMYRPEIPFEQPKQKMNWGVKIFLIILAVLAIGFTIGFLAYGAVAVTQTSYNISQDNNGTSSRYSQQEASELEIEEQIPNWTNPSFQGLNLLPSTGDVMTPEQVYQKASASMVSVLTVAGGDDDQSVSSSQGSGIIATSDGYIITNAHVISYTKSAKITVVTHDQKQYDGVVVGFDKDADLAVIKIEAQDLSAAVFGSSNDLSVGQTVIAIGNPGGVRYSGSMTMGIVSALNRSVGNYSSTGITYIQTDTAINPGNSGGGLINMRGQVVGINTIKVVSSGFEGMGFSIPIDQVKSILDTLIREGSIPAVGRLGITGGTRYLPVDGQNYTVASGVLVSSIDSESPLYNSNLQVGDLIIGFNGIKVVMLEDIYAQLKAYRVGQEITLSIRRITDAEDIVFEVKTEILKRES